MRGLALMIVCLVAATACRKKSSPQFFDAQGRYAVISAKLGDDAYDDPELSEIETMLRDVPAQAKEYEQAQALLTTIGAEKARVRAEKAALAQPVVAAPEPLFPPAPPREVPAAEEGKPTVDAGFSPHIGMSIDAFLAAYSACMSATEDVLMPGAKQPGQAFAVRKTKVCLDQFGGTEKFTRLFVFVDRKLAGEASRTEPDNDKPYAGMTTDVFTKSFGDCMSAGPEVTMPGAKTPSQSFTVKSTKACTDRFGGTADSVKSFVFSQGKLVGETVHPVTPPADTQPMPAFVPGASLPTGVNSALPPPDPSTAVTPDSNQQRR